MQAAIDIYFEGQRMQEEFSWTRRPASCEHRDVAPIQHHVITVYPRVLLLTLGRWPDQHQTVTDVVHTNETIRFQNLGYELRSIVFHQGDTVKTGHYYCYVKHESITGDWWYYNNGLRRAASLADIQNVRRDKSYILFYEQMV